MPTRTDNYFLHRFEAPSMAAAVEKAAASLLPPTLDMLDPLRAIPVKLEPILEERHIVLVQDRLSQSGPEGRLRVEDDRFVVSVRADRAPTRHRFSVAHEIAHTLFYERENGMWRHQVGLFSEAERAAEERICDRVASAVLAPGPVVRRLLGRVERLSPGALLHRLDRTAIRLRMSISALAARLGDLGVPERGLLVLNLQCFPNRNTGADNRLRVVGGSCLQRGFAAPHIWSNVSATQAGLAHADALFSAWAGDHAAGLAECAGRFVWHDGVGLSRWRTGVPPSYDQLTKVWARRYGRWAELALNAKVASALYAPPSGRIEDARIIVVAAYDVQSWRGVPESRG